MVIVTLIVAILVYKLRTSRGAQPAVLDRTGIDESDKGIPSSVGFPRLNEEVPGTPRNADSAVTEGGRLRGY